MKKENQSSGAGDIKPTKIGRIASVTHKGISIAGLVALGSASLYGLSKLASQFDMNGPILAVVRALHQLDIPATEQGVRIFAGVFMGTLVYRAAKDLFVNRSKVYHYFTNQENPSPMLSGGGDFESSDRLSEMEKNVLYYPTEPSGKKSNQSKGPK